MIVSNPVMHVVPMAILPSASMNQLPATTLSPKPMRFAICAWRFTICDVELIIRVIIVITIITVLIPQCPVILTGNTDHRNRSQQRYAHLKRLFDSIRAVPLDQVDRIIGGIRNTQRGSKQPDGSLGKAEGACDAEEQYQRSDMS